MKFLKLFLLIPIFAFSFEVEFNKKFSHELPHDTLTTYLIITIQDDTELIVGERLEVFNKKIKSYDKVERKLGTFNIRPKYKYSSNTPKIVGYLGELRYKVNSRKARFMDEFISEITKLKKNRDTTVAVNNLSWTVREDTYNVTLDLLRLEAITWGQRYANTLSSDIDKDCKVKKININTTNQTMNMREKAIYASASISNKSIPVPEANQEKIKINPNYVLECE
ncbi:SIMPL domain-containing protein [Arcobacter sp. LA11]|uniref:SIMPL domain-containing protein n=1 Tax=Arcobacter sp. LA11 TaxID=1898176 RepID=UPI00093269EF|nr:SIMPL domain-containing protein [Arcobacter sp. LA11]